MKRNLMLLAAGLVASVAFVACGSVPTLTFQQQVALVCADGDAAITIMKDDGVFTGGALDTLNKTVQPDLDKVCAAGATVTTVNLKNLTNATLPLLKALVSASNVTQQLKNEANAAIDLTLLAVNTAVALEPAAVPTAASGASGASAASAPVAASTPLAGAPLQ